MPRIILHVICLWALLCPALAEGEWKPPVDLLLVLASDVSMSVDDKKFQLQREGYAAAIQDPRVLRAARAGLHGRIAVSFIEWSYEYEQKVVIDWSVIDGPLSGQRFAAQLLKQPRSFFGHTGIGAAILFSIQHLEKAPFVSERRVIDISGDGTNNSGPRIEEAREKALRMDISINGLVIETDLAHARFAYHTNPTGGLREYYQKNVIGGPGSFVLVARGFASFGQTVINKMIAEIAMR